MRRLVINFRLQLSIKFYCFLLDIIFGMKRIIEFIAQQIMLEAVEAGQSFRIAV